MKKRISLPIIILVSILGLGLAAFGVFKGYKNIGEGGRLDEVKELLSAGNLDEVMNRLKAFEEGNKVSASTLGKIYFELASQYDNKGEIVKARDLYEAILNKYQNVDNIIEVEDALGRLNTKLIFSPIITTKDVLYKVQQGDNLTNIAKRFGTTIELVKAANSLKSDMIRVTQQLKVPTAKFKILIDKSQNVLTLLLDNGTIFKAYKVSTGLNNCTPTGTFKIVNRIKDPVWYKEGAIVPSESPENILGSRWLGFSLKGYGIHGTTEPDKVGQQATQGCVRMLNSDVEEVYTIVPIGTEVTIVD